MANIPLILYVLTTSLGLILLKLGSNHGAVIEIISHKPAFNLTCANVLGIVMYGISFILYTYLISKNDLGYIIPITTALVYIIIFLASFIIFKESFTLMKVTAIFMILLGVILLKLKP